MIKVSKACLLFVYLLVGSACVTHGPQPRVVNGMTVVGGSDADLAAFLKLQKTWINSYLSGDLDTLMTLHNDESILMPRRTPDLNGPSEIRAFFADRVGQYDIDFRDDPRELQFNGNWAFLFGHFSLTGTPKTGGDVFRDQGRYFILYKKDSNGDWKIFRDLDNSLPAPDAN